MKPLSIKEITLTNFKNYASSTFQLGERFNLAFGLNGAGKTNLLDSIYYLAVGKSYFTPQDQKVVRYGESFFRLTGKVERGHDMHSIVMKVVPGISKELLVDDVALGKVSEHLGFIPVVISAPKDIDLVVGSSQSRRKYIDHLLCQVDRQYLSSLVTYNHLLQMRTSALKQDYPDLRRIVQTFDDQIAPHAAYIFNRRELLQQEIKALMKHYYSLLSDDREPVSLEYESQLKGHAYELLADLHWEADKNLRRSNAGIHKDDIVLSVKNMPAKDYASQGQIKSLIFALHLSKFELLSRFCGHKPVLIFDDIFDKLDEKRLASLMEILKKENFGQVFLSDTNRHRVASFVASTELNEIFMS